MEASQQTFTREELRQKLRNKIASKKQPKVQVNPNEYKQMMKQMKEELAKMNSDERISPKMMDMYNKVSMTFAEIKVPSPLELLNNQELGKHKFKEYLCNLIKSCAEKNISKDIFIKDYLNSDYTHYHIAVLGKDVIPEKLREDVFFIN